MAKKEGNGKLLVGALLILVVVFGGLLLLGGDNSKVKTGEVTNPGDTNTPASPTTSPTKSGALEFYLRAGNGGTGTTDSSLILLDPSYAKYDDKGVFNQDATRYAIMAQHYTKGITSLKAFPGGGTPKAITSTAGLWSEPQLVAKKNDKFVVFTWEDTSPAAGENISTAHLVTLNDFDAGSSKWVATNELGQAYWNLNEYATYDWYNGQDAIKAYYYLDDQAVVKSAQTVTMYTRATVKDQYAPDLSIYISAPSNFTGKFVSLSVTDKAGHNKKFTSLTKAENYGGTDPINLASTILPTSVFGSTWNWYYVGSLGNDFLTLNTEQDKNRLTWELTSDTYGSNVSVNVTAVMNAGATTTNNGAFQIAHNFGVILGSGAADATDDSRYYP